MDKDRIEEAEREAQEAREAAEREAREAREAAENKKLEEQGRVWYWTPRLVKNLCADEDTKRQMQADDAESEAREAAAAAESEAREAAAAEVRAELEKTKEAHEQVIRDLERMKDAFHLTFAVSSFLPLVALMAMIPLASFFLYVHGDYRLFHSAYLEFFEWPSLLVLNFGDFYRTAIVFFELLPKFIQFEFVPPSIAMNFAFLGHSALIVLDIAFVLGWSALQLAEKGKAFYDDAKEEAQEGMEKKNTIISV
eukprot:TRINITY_DN64308_c0_g1_i1.p2 TRINITY_DN64308_c0_g1~~TRINITY_DN64308_c0_g1_i1.p2  ORF type:complete len:253 (-),score=56.80 TRINITY_DN64308_c0_g1_i1:235-993(-)